MACAEALPRTLAALLLPDYLRHPPHPDVEDALDTLRRPSLGHWVGLCRELAAHLDPDDTVCSDAVHWLRDSGNALLDELVQHRNALVHGGATDLQPLQSTLDQLLESLTWFRRYRLFRVVEQQTTRRRTFQGRIQLLQGPEEWTQPVPASWDVPLIHDAVYLIGPDADVVLEISPFIQVRRIGQRESILLFLDAPDGGDCRLLHVPTGEIVLAPVDSDTGPLGFEAWLAERAHHLLRQDAQGLGGALAPRTAASLTPGDRVGPYRVLEKLSDHTFRAEGDGESVVIRTLAADEPVADWPTHPHLCGFTRFDEPAALVSPWLPSLATRIDGLTAEDRRDWSSQLLAALGALHQAGVTHGSVGPHSCFVREGLLLGNAGSQHRDPVWTAPELTRGQSPTPASDAYGAGVVLHLLAAGELPKGPPGRGLSGPLGRVVRGLTERDPSQRLTARGALTVLEHRGKALPRGWPVPTPAAADLLRQAQSLAEAGRHGFVGLEHLVLALSRDARDEDVRRLWLLVGDTELTMRAILAGLTPHRSVREPVLTPRLQQWSAQLQDGFGVPELEQMLREDAGHLLHELSAAGSLLRGVPSETHAGRTFGGATLGASTLGPGASLGEGPTRLVVVGGPEDGRVLFEPGEKGWVGRYDGTESITGPLYLATDACTDRRLSRKHLYWAGTEIELRRPTKLISPLGEVVLQSGIHRIFPGTLLELSVSTRLRSLPIV